MGGRHVDLHTVEDLEMGGSAMFVESFGCVLLHIGVVRSGKAMEGSGRGLEGLSESSWRNEGGMILSGCSIFRVGQGGDSRGERGDRWGTEIHFKWARAAERLVGDRVVRKTDALRERRPM